MTYEWNPMWSDICDTISDAYVQKVRAMVMASVNWMAEHPTALDDLRWQERVINLKGLKDEAPDAKIEIIAPWDAMYRARNLATEQWFKAIVDACGHGNDAPTSLMMGKAMACGQLFAARGWDAFSAFMMTLEQPQVKN